MAAFSRRSRSFSLVVLLPLIGVASIARSDPPDGDLDGVTDAMDNCVAKSNPLQIDVDIDGYGNACDADYDNNGVMGVSDYGTFVNAFGLTVASPNWCTNVHPSIDFDSNGGIGISEYGFIMNSFAKPVGPSGLACAGDYPCAVDGDLDDDATENVLDNCILDPNSAQVDADSDGYGNACDADFDDDGVVTDADSAIMQCARRAISPAQSGYNPEADLDENGVVSPTDSEIFSTLRNRCTPGRSALIENGPIVPVPGVAFSDDDEDGVVRYLDNCRLVVNPSQTNSDYDRFGNACDADYNNSGSVDGSDLTALNAVMGLTSSDPGFDPDMDHDDDGVIGQSDLDFFSGRVGLPLGPSGLACRPIPPVTSDDYVHGFQGQVLTGQLHASDPDGTPLTFAISSQPAHGEIDVDSETGVFSYTPDEGSGAISDVFEFTANDGGVTSLPARVNISLWDPQGSSFSTTELPAKALVLYNLNYPGADELAGYYADAREIPSSHLCAVRMPPGLYASKDQMLSLRKQVVEGCICPLIPEADRPAPCTAGNPAIADHSPISHLVFMKGLPARMHGTGWTEDFWEPTLDYYLSHLIYRDTDLFDCPTCPQANGASLGVGYLDQTAPVSPAYLREIDVARDRFLAYSRIEAMTVDRTKALIDRTLAAEAGGFSGNLLTEENLNTVGEFDFEFTRRLAGSFDPVCEAYIAHEPFVWKAQASTWPHEECRAGTTYAEADGAVSGLLPGDQSGHSTIPTVVDAGFLMGSYTSDPLGVNGHSGFNHAGTLPNWRKTELNCTPLCSDLPGGSCPPPEPNEFRDYFGKLNPECVGVAPGFLGFQLRSYPVQYYGFFPPGWANGNGGAEEKTPPVQVTGGAFAGSRYLHLGARAVGDPDTSTCPRLDGSQEACKEQIVLWLEADYVPATPLPVSGTRRFEVRLRHRNPANPGGKMQVWLEFHDGSTYYTRSGQFPLDVERLSWHGPAPISFDAEASEASEIDRIRLRLKIEFSDQVFGALDLDAVELVDTEAPGNVTIGDLIGGFEAEPGSQTHPGDYAANAIDRLGAIGWWGSSSHFIGGGHSFGESGPLMQSFFSGRTLGESVLAGRVAMAGLVYGDPLYRPSAAALFIPSDPRTKYHMRGYMRGGLLIGSDDPLVVTNQNLESSRYLFMNVLHGTAHLADVQWQLSVCPNLDPVACSQQSLWSANPVLAGQGSVKERPIEWTQYINTAVDQPVTFRLKVWNTGEESRALYDFASFDYRVNEVPE